MLRFSTLLEQVLAKVESSREQAPTPTADASQSETEVPVLAEGVSEATSDIHSCYLLDSWNSQHSPLTECPPLDYTSRKRKRTDECECVDEDEDAPKTDRSPVEAPPSKRQRQGHGTTVVKGIATAAGFTTLGAVATWATLAYYI